VKTIRNLDELPPREKYNPGKVVIGVDPGLGGGIAVKYADNNVFTFSMPGDVEPLRELVERITYPDSLNTAYVEDVPPFVGNPLPGARMFRLGESCGLIRGVLSTLYIKTVLVRPQEWQGGLGLKREKGQAQAAWKRTLREAAQELYPDIRVTLKTADALLIMHYGISQQN